MKNKSAWPVSCANGPRKKTMYVTTRNSHQVIWVNGLGPYRVTGTVVLWVWAPSWLSSSTRVFSTRLWVKSWNKRTSRHVPACLRNTQWRNLQNTHYVFLVCRPVNGMNASEFFSLKTFPSNLNIPENFSPYLKTKCATFLDVLKSKPFRVCPLCFNPLMSSVLPYQIPFTRVGILILVTPR